MTTASDVLFNSSIICSNFTIKFVSLLSGQSSLLNKPNLHFAFAGAILNIIRQRRYVRACQRADFSPRRYRHHTALIRNGTEAGDGCWHFCYRAPFSKLRVCRDGRWWRTYAIGRSFLDRVRFLRVCRNENLLPGALIKVSPFE